MSKKAPTSLIRRVARSQLHFLTPDVFYTNSRYAKVGGLPSYELNQLELQFLLLNDFRLVIAPEELQRYADRLLSYWEGQEAESGLASGMAGSGDDKMDVDPRPRSGTTPAPPTPNRTESTPARISHSEGHSVSPRGRERSSKQPGVTFTEPPKPSRVSQWKTMTEPVGAVASVVEG